MSPTPVPRLVRALPMVFVRDIDRATAWYRDVLGFELVFSFGSPPFFAEVRRDDAALNLRRTDVTPWAPSDEPDLLAASISVTDVEALFLEHQQRGAEFHQRVQHHADGWSDYIVRDPDGNLLWFGAAL